MASPQASTAPRQTGCSRFVLAFHMDKVQRQSGIYVMRWLFQTGQLAPATDQISSIACPAGDGRLNSITPGIWQLAPNTYQHASVIVCIMRHRIRSSVVAQDHGLCGLVEWRVPNNGTMSN